MKGELEDYLGNDRGVVLGPYAPGEIHARLRGQQVLTEGYSGEPPQVYAIKARSLADARQKLAAEIRRSR